MEYITSKQMAIVDKIAMKNGIKIDQMMELAGKNLANFVLRLKPKSVSILYGKGNNGGGGLVAARHLRIKGIKVKIIPASNENNKNVTHQLKILKNMRIIPSKKLEKSDVIVDALLGYNIKGNPRKNYAKLINQINKSKAKVVSLDLPSGLDPNSGDPHNPTVKADYTLTLALPKKGLKKLKNVYLANVGIPNSVYKKLKIPIKNYFNKSDIIKV